MSKFLKGIIIGISTTIPGVCSALLAIILKVYDSLLELIEKFYDFKVIRKNIGFIIGIVIGVLLCIICMDYLFDNYQNYLECIFLGLTLGGLYKIIKEQKKLENVDFLMIIIGISFSIIPELLFNNKSDNSNYWLIIIGGFLSSLAFILPGISGSLLLLTLGIYQTVINGLSGLIKFFYHIPSKEMICVSLGFIFSFVIGSLVFVKIIRKILKKHERKFITFCLGLMIGSLILITFSVIQIELPIIIKTLWIIGGLSIIKFLN